MLAVGVANAGDGVETTLIAGDVTVTVPSNAEEDLYTLKVEGTDVTTDNNDSTTATFEVKLLKDGVPVAATGGIKYAVNIEVGTDLFISAVTHNDVAISGYTCDSSTGTVAFETDFFRPFAVASKQIPADAVKVVDRNGNTDYFIALNEAAAAVTGNATITVRSNITLEETSSAAQSRNSPLKL